MLLTLVAIPKPGIVAVDQLTRCTNEYHNLMTCSTQTQSGCSLSCTQGELDNISKYSMGFCAETDDFCGVSMCCPTCWELIGAYQGCLFEQYACDTSCKKFLPPPMSGPVAAPSPIMVANPPNAGSNDDDDSVGVSPECLSTQTALETCFTKNFESCSASFFSCVSNEPVEEATLCQSLNQICHDATCCEPCAAIGKEFVECELRVRGCSGDCSNGGVVAVNDKKHNMKKHNMKKHSMKNNKSNKMTTKVKKSGQMKTAKADKKKKKMMTADKVMKSDQKMGTTKGEKAGKAMDKKNVKVPKGRE
jgi:hypothetical protein